MSIKVFRLCPPADPVIPHPWAVTDAYAHRIIAFCRTWAEAIDTAVQFADEVTDS